MSMYKSTINSCVDRLNTEYGRESASQMMLGDNYMQAISKIPQVSTMHDKPDKLCSELQLQQWQLL